MQHKAWLKIRPQLNEYHVERGSLVPRICTHKEKLAQARNAKISAQGRLAKYNKKLLDEGKRVCLYDGGTFIPRKK